MNRLTTLLTVVTLVAGCTSGLDHRTRAPVNLATAPQDYIMRLVESIAGATSGFALDGGSSCVEIVDARGQGAKIWWDQSGSHQKEFKDAGYTWFGRRFGEIVLGSLKDGRSLLIPSEECSKLLRLLEDADRRGLDAEGFAFYIEDIKAKQHLPNKSLEPTPKAVTHRADARRAPALGVAHH